MKQLTPIEAAVEALCLLLEESDGLTYSETRYLIELKDEIVARDLERGLDYL
jgi:hypothetical protein